MKRIFITTFLLIFTSLIFAQEADSVKYGWTTKELAAGLNVAQTSYDNFVKGGEDSYAWQLSINYKFINDQEKISWLNTGKFNYGNTKTGKAEAVKSVDEIKLESVLSYKIGIKVNPFIAITGETQFADGFSYKTDPKTRISAFMDPGYFRESAGFGYYPIKSIFTRLGFSMKQTITSDFPGYADDPETGTIEKIKSEIGLDSVTDFDFKLSKTSALKSKLELFSNLKKFDEIDVNWDTILTAQVSQFISMNFNVKLLYDKDISKKRQLKQVLGVGLTYNFF